MQVLSEDNLLKEEMREQQVIIEQPQTAPLTSTSLLQQYQAIIDPELSIPTDQQIIQLLYRRQQIVFQPDNFQPVLSAKIVKHMPHHQIITLNIAYGFFNLTVDILCQNGDSLAHFLPRTESSQEAAVFFGSQYDNDNMVAIKCFPIGDYQDSSHVFASILREFFIGKIASGLGIGPKIPKYGGFDLLFHNKCIQFAMEKCQELRSRNTNQIQQSTKKLKKKLKILHRLKILHLDIKPSNIMFSPHNQEVVFIDFGFSKIIAEDVGDKSLCYFSGSINYCSQEMLKAFRKDQVQMVDLYYNDALSLQITLQQLNSFNPLEQISCYTDDIFSHSYFFPQNLKHLQNFREEQALNNIKKSIYERQPILLSDSKIRQSLIRQGNNIIAFILQFPYYDFLNDIFLFVIRNNKEKIVEASFERRMECKKEKLLRSAMIEGYTNDKQHQNSVFLKRLNLKQSTEQVLLGSESNQKIMLTVKQNLFKKVLDSNQREKMTIFQYWTTVAQVIDLRNSLTSFQQKIQVCTIFLKNIETPVKDTDTQQFKLTLTFRTLLTLFISSAFKSHPKKNIELPIPLLVVNLVILESIAPEQLVCIITKIPQLCQNPLTIALTLVRLVPIFLWIIEKIRTRYTHYNICELHLAFEKQFLNLTQNCQHQRLMQLIMKAYMSRQLKDNFTHTDYQELRQILQPMEDLTLKEKEQVMALAIFQAFKQGDYCYKQSNLKMILELHQHGGIDFLQIYHFDYHHLKLMLLFPTTYEVNSSKTNNYQQLTSVLSEANLLRQFSFYYFSNFDVNDFTFESSIRSGQISRDISFLAELLEQNGNQRRCAIRWLLLILKRLSTINKTKIYFDIVEQLKSITILVAMTYINKKGRTKENVIFFFDSCQYLIQMVYMIFRQNSPHIILAHQLLDKMKDNQAKVDHYFDNYFHHTLRKAQLTMMINQGKIKEGTNICLDEIEIILANVASRSYLGDISNYLGRLAVFIKKIESDSGSKDDYSMVTYNIIKNNQLFGTIFDEQFGSQIYYFISTFTLLRLKSLPSYLEFHFAILKLIKDHPFTRSILKYRVGLQKFFKQNYKATNQMAESIAEELMKDMRKYDKNAYLCLPMSFLLKYPINETMLLKLCLKVCQFCDQISIEARVYVLNQLFNYLIRSQTAIESIRSKRRKIIMHANYLTNERSFQQFSAKLKLSVHTKKSMSLKHCKLMEKRKKFWKKMQAQPLKQK